MRLSSLQLGEPYAGIELAYVDWGDIDADRVVVCVHGLTRNSRDFDHLANHLAKSGYRVIAVDVVGRGRSSWLEDPRGYIVPNYVGQLKRFLELLRLSKVDWVGTSMGGIIGMVIASSEDSPITRLILNDIGPQVAQSALKEIQSYLGMDLTFDGFEELEEHLRLIHARFGQLTDAQWRHLAQFSARQTDKGWVLGYDPGIRVPFEDVAAEGIDLWAVWDAITCPAFVLHGIESNVLRRQTTVEMQKRGPRAEVVHLQNVGHAPALMSNGQISIIDRWLAGGAGPEHR